MTAGRYRHLDEMSPWSDRLHHLEVIGIADEAPGVKTFTFRSDPDRWFRYRPGQFVTLELPADGGPLLRTYTLSSSPSRPFSIAVTVKAQADSVGTRWMFQHLRVGARIRAYGPAGQFTHVAHPAARYLFLSAGSGITPMMSVLRYLTDTAWKGDIFFFYGARSTEEFVFRDELERLERRFPNLHVVAAMQRAPGTVWMGPEGPITREMILAAVPEIASRRIHMCGPPAMMGAMRGVLAELRRFYYEVAQAAHPGALSSLTRLVKVNRILFGTDAPNTAITAAASTATTGSPSASPTRCRTSAPSWSSGAATPQA